MLNLKQKIRYTNYIMGKWNDRFYELAKTVATWSKDTNRQVGCVFVNEDNIVLSLGYNGFPRNTDDDNYPERYEKPVKYDWTEHAETNAIFNATRMGIKLKGSSVYCTFFPCHSCTRALIQIGVKNIYAPKPDVTHEKWGPSWKISLEMLNETNISIQVV